jgi:hypothetical protein
MGKVPMKCTICGKHAPSGTRLCTPCRAALKRARKATVSRYRPLRLRTPDPRRARVPSAQQASGRAHGAAHRAARRSPPRRGEVAAFVALSVVACALGLLAIRMLGDARPGWLPFPARAQPAAAQPRDAGAKPTGPAAVPAGPPAAVPAPKEPPGGWPVQDATDRAVTVPTRTAQAPAGPASRAPVARGGPGRS